VRLLDRARGTAAQDIRARHAARHQLHADPVSPSGSVDKQADDAGNVVVAHFARHQPAIAGRHGAGADHLPGQFATRCIGFVQRAVAVPGALDRPLSARMAQLDAGDNALPLHELNNRL
jgi:hypothetical protein